MPEQTQSESNCMPLLFCSPNRARNDYTALLVLVGILAATTYIRSRIRRRKAARAGCAVPQPPEKP